MLFVSVRPRHGNTMCPVEYVKYICKGRVDGHGLGLCQTSHRLLHLNVTWLIVLQPRSLLLTLSASLLCISVMCHVLKLCSLMEAYCFVCTLAHETSSCGVSH